MDLPVPIQIRNAPTRLAKDLGHGKDYRYPHDHPHGFVEQSYLPQERAGTTLYEPKETGDERETAKRWRWRRKLRGR